MDCEFTVFKLGRDNNNDGDKDGTWDKLAETTFNMYFRQPFAPILTS
jgi:hypothetical protein